MQISFQMANWDEKSVKITCVNKKFSWTPVKFRMEMCDKTNVLEKVTIENENDDDECRLPADTLAILQEFLTEQASKKDEIEEDWVRNFLRKILPNVTLKF